MLKIICPSNNIPERNYAITVLFNELLGCDLSSEAICFDNSVEHYEIQGGGKKVVVEDHFFQKYPDPLTYLDQSHIPSSLNYFHAKDMEIPIIYGEDKYVENEESITIGLDIFASTFFMLTRWEESLLGREEKGDCDENQLFAVKMNIYQRPIVHEYEELLRLLFSDCGMTFRERKYNVVMSHDVDGFLTPSYRDVVKSVIRQLRYGPPKNKVLNLTWKEKLKYKRTFPDAFCQFEMYTSLCRNYDIPEWFYFKVCDTGEEECTYKYDAIETKEVVKRLKKENNPKIMLGFHPSQSTLGNEKQWDKEQDRINSLIGYAPEIGRNHHLLSNYKMLRMWEKMAKNVLEGDLEISNCVFHNKIGYRSGMAIPYHLFDIYERRPMKLREHPCQVMDTVIRYHRKDKTEKEIWEEIKPVVESTKKYECELVLTWHIYIRNKKLICDYYKWCENVVHYASEQ